MLLCLTWQYTACLNSYLHYICIYTYTTHHDHLQCYYYLLWLCILTLYDLLRHSMTANSSYLHWYVLTTYVIGCSVHCYTTQQLCKDRYIITMQPLKTNITWLAPTTLYLGRVHHSCLQHYYMTSNLRRHCVAPWPIISLICLFRVCYSSPKPLPSGNYCFVHI